MSTQKKIVQSPSKNIAQSESASVDVEETKVSIPKIIEMFEEAHLKEALMRGVYSYGWEKPSYIQQQGIPAILTGRDVIMQAQSGMGKTGTFSVSLLEQINEN